MPQLKRWESPRKTGRNHKGRGGAARARQVRKQQKRLLKRLKAQPSHQDASPPPGEVRLSFFMAPIA